MSERIYCIYKDGYLVASESDPQQAIAIAKQKAGEGAVSVKDMNVFLDKGLSVCRFVGANGEFYIRGRDRPEKFCGFRGAEGKAIERMADTDDITKWIALPKTQGITVEEVKARMKERGY